MAQHTDPHLQNLASILSKSTKDTCYQSVVDAPFEDKLQSAMLGLGIVALIILNKKDKTLDRVAISQTDRAKDVLKSTVKPFYAIKIPASTQSNLIATAVRTGKTQITTSWSDLLTPALTPKDAALDQTISAIGCSIVEPFKCKTLSGALLFDFFLGSESLTKEHNDFIEQYTKLVTQIFDDKKVAYGLPR